MCYSDCFAIKQHISRTYVVGFFGCGNRVKEIRERGMIKDRIRMNGRESELGDGRGTENGGREREGPGWRLRGEN